MSDDVTITVRTDDRTATGFRDVNGRLRDMRGRFASAAGDMRRSAASVGGAINSVQGNITSLQGSMGGLHDSLGGVQGGFARLAPSVGQVGAALGVSLLPALGAAAPMLAGFGAAGGAAALAMGGMKKQAKELKKPFEEWQKVSEKAVLPHTAKAVDSLKSAMEDLNPAIKIGGESFGRVAEQAGKFADSPAFKTSLLKNVEMGSGFFETMAGSVGKFSQSFLDFGAKSQPTLDAFERLAGGALGKGLPDMFKGLEKGIGGASQVLDGLAYALNDKILPALGDFSGAFAKAAGPGLREGLMLLGDGASYAFGALAKGAQLAAPILDDLGQGFRAVREFAAATLPTLADTGRAVFEALVPFSQIEDGAGPFRRLADAIEENRGRIQEGTRQVGQGIITMAEVAISSAPTVITVFQGMASGVLTSLDGIISGAAAAFGWVPEIGGKLKSANKDFDEFSASFQGALGDAKTKADSFAAEALPKLEQGRLKLDINSWQRQLTTAKQDLKTVPPEKRAALKALIADLQAKVRQARADLATIQSRSVTITAFVQYKGKSIAAVSAGRMATGGVVQGPGTDTSDDVPIMASNDEFIVNAKSSRKHRRLLESINEDQLPRFASGGKVSQATKDARAGLSGSFGISHFGRMAGYGVDPFERSLGKPADIGALVSALNGARGDIRAAFSGKTESRLLKMLDSTGNSLLKYEKQLTGVNKALESAKGKLSDLKSAASSLSSSVKGGVLSSASITKGASGDGPVTVASIMGGLTASRDKATAFAGALKDLQKKGVSKDLIQQIAEAGISGGGLETAGALLGASSSEIQSMNSLQGQINSAATAAGKNTADAVYGAAIKAQTASVTRLQKSQDKLEKTMSDLAKTLEKALQRALAGKAAGGIVGAAASGGIRSNLTWVGEQGPELLDLPSGSRVWSNADSKRKAQAPWASMLNTPRSGRSASAPAAAGGGSSAPLVIQVRFGDKDLGELWVAAGRNEVRARGGSLKATLLARDI